MSDPADEEELKRTIVSARLLNAGLAAGEFACLLTIWMARPHSAIVFLSVYLFCFSIPILTNWLLLAQQNAAVEISRISLHLTTWAMILGALGLFFFILNLSIVGSVIFLGTGIVSLFHFNDRNARFAAVGRALIAPIYDLLNQGRSQ